MVEAGLPLLAMKPTRIQAVDPYDWMEILRASREEGHRMVERLLNDFRSGANRFDQPGEALFAHLAGEAVIAAGGLNLEQETRFGRAGRIRRLYVSPQYRGKGLGRSLVEAIASFTSEHHDVLTVNVGKLPAYGFYEQLGFTPVEHPGITHIRELSVRSDG